jgi:hypothetical protein
MAVMAIDRVCYLFSFFLPPLKKNKKMLLVLVRLASKTQSDRTGCAEALIDDPI